MNPFHQKLRRRSFIEWLGLNFIPAAAMLHNLARPVAPAEINEVNTMNEIIRTGLVSPIECQKHLTGPGHPESPRRHEAVLKGLAATELLPQLISIDARPATQEEVLACHSRPYFETVKRDVESGSRNLSTGDTTISEDSLDVALLSAGGILNAVDAVVEGRIGQAFCAVRPPGHHANSEKGMGFCLFNNIAIAARYAQNRHQIGKVLIADWDVHHGNGTQDIFYEDQTVFFFDTHQAPWYPGTGHEDETGRGPGKGFTMNCPFPAGAGRDEIVGAFRDKLVKAAAAFRPELILVSAGFDSRMGDPLGHFQLTDEDFAELTGIMKDIAREHAGGRLVSVLEGGYDLGGLSSAVNAHVQALLD
jgi:acetoin utilization deacetylase AcuC-like enzyme